MANMIEALLPKTQRRLHALGDRLRMARLRRRLPAKLVAERAGMSAMTLRSLERGGPGVTIAAYAAVLQVLGLDEDLDLLAKEDALGRTLQDTAMPGPKRRASPSVATEPRSSAGREAREGRTRVVPRVEASDAPDAIARRVRVPTARRTTGVRVTAPASGERREGERDGAANRPGSRSVSSDELLKLISPAEPTSDEER